MSESSTIAPDLARATTPWRWLLLLGLSLPLWLALEALRLPAALLLGPMLAAIVLAALGAPVRVPPLAMGAGQAVLGCLIAHAIRVSLLIEILHRWPIFAAGVFSVLAAATFLGWLLARLKVLPGTTAIWGTAPGAAAAMTLMAEAYGADMRLVAFMQYLRVMVVATLASLVARIWTQPEDAAHAAGAGWLASFAGTPVAWAPFAGTLAVAMAGGLIGRALRLPAGALLATMVIATLLQDTGLLTITLPPWLLAPAYAVVGWSIGARFTRSVMTHALRMLPQVLGCILALVLVCGCFAYGLVRLAGVDPLTAYLATSPGGADSVAIIAAGSKVDMPFVMAMQIARFLVVLTLGPPLARLIAGRPPSPT